jgi:CheY-like chemotaxis protein
MNMRLLIAEDNDDLRRTFTLAFERSGFEVQAVCDGEEALTELKDGIPDVLIVDIGLPRVSGIDVIRFVREKETTRRTKIVVVTGNHLYDQAPEASLADLFLIKPVRPTDLVRLAKRFSQETTKTSNGGL